MGEERASMAAEDTSAPDARPACVRGVVRRSIEQGCSTDGMVSFRRAPQWPPPPRVRAQFASPRTKRAKSRRIDSRSAGRRSDVRSQGRARAVDIRGARRAGRSDSPPGARHERADDVQSDKIEGGRRVCHVHRLNHNLLGSAADVRSNRGGRVHEVRSKQRRQ